MPSGAPNENENALKHGGATARKALSTGEEFTGPAKIAELAVTDELQLNGRTSIVERGAIRLQAAADLYWGALSQAAEQTPEPDARLFALANEVSKRLIENGQTELAEQLKKAIAQTGNAAISKRLQSYTKTFGWLQSKALTAWQQLKVEQEALPSGMDYEQILNNQDNDR